MKFTKDAIGALVCPPGKSDHVTWDDDLPGFGIRLRRSGAKSWIVQYRVGRQQRRESLGDIRKVRLADAREAARTRFAQIQLGIDPGAERDKAEAAAAAAGLTLAKVIGRYLADKQTTLRASTFRAASRYFNVHWKPLHDRPISEIKRPEVAAVLQAIIKERGRVAAARARSNLSALFGWAIGEGLCGDKDNPVLNTNQPDKGVPPRDRVLSDSELAAIWQNCFGDDFGRVIKLLILTGCRREEIGALKWGEVNLHTGILVLPGSRTKTGRTLELKLPDVAIDILRSGREGREHVFGSRGGAFSAWSYGCRQLNARIAATKGEPLPPWTIHDIRRSVRTGMGRLGVQPHIAEFVLNHARKGIEATYDRYKYEREIGAALASWARYVVTLVIDPGLYAAHEAYLARGDTKEARDKARAVFETALADGGASWDRYLKVVVSRGKLVPLRA